MTYSKPTVILYADYTTTGYRAQGFNMIPTNPQPINRPINPFKQIRLDTGLSQYKLADKAGVSKHAVLRLEQGMFSEPLPKLLNFFVSEFNVSRASLLHQYSEFQKRTRYNNAWILGELLDARLFKWGSSDSEDHPLVYLRRTAPTPLNPTQLAKALCISQTVVTYFEKKSISQQSVPTQLLVALKDARYSEDELFALEEAYAVYRVNLKRVRYGSTNVG